MGLSPGVIRLRRLQVRESPPAVAGESFDYGIPQVAWLPRARPRRTLLRMLLLRLPPGAGYSSAPWTIRRLEIHNWLSIPR